MVEKVILAKSVIGALIIYIMQATALLKGTLEEIERYQRCFLWDHDSIERKIHTTPCNRFC